MSRIVAIGAKQHSGKTIAAKKAAPYACDFVTDPDAHRATVTTHLGFRPSAVSQMFHDMDDNPMGIVKSSGHPKLRDAIASRTGSMNSPPSAPSGSAKWHASVKKAKEDGYDPNRAYFWSNPSWHEGDDADVFLPHDSILLDDWQFIVANVISRAGDTVKDKNGDIDYMEIGKSIGVPLGRVFLWLRQQPIHVVLTSHLRKPGKVRDGTDIDAGGIMMATRSGAEPVLSTMWQTLLMRPPAATAERVSVGAMGVKVTGGKIEGPLELLDADDDLDPDLIFAKPATTLEGLERFANLFVHFPPGDPGLNNWLTRDQSGVLWSGGCPGALYGLYAGAGKETDYPFQMRKVVTVACKEALKATKADDLYRAAMAGLNADESFAALRADSSPDATQRKLAILKWALHEAYATWIAAARWRTEGEDLFGRFLG